MQHWLALKHTALDALVVAYDGMSCKFSVQYNAADMQAADQVAVVAPWLMPWALKSSIAEGVNGGVDCSL